MYQTEEPPVTPTLSPEQFERLQAAVESRGPAAAIDALADDLKALGDYHGLFYALLLKKRFELGAPLYPTGAAAELPPDTHAAYEEAIRTSAREVGNLFLKGNELSKAAFYFRMIAEPGALVDYIESYTPGDDEDPQPVIDVAFYQGVSPKRGFDILLERYGTCNAITAVHSHDFSHSPEAKRYCAGRLIETLHEQVRERLESELSSAGHAMPGATIQQMVEAHPELFEEGAYHVDTSHLSSVVQMSLELPPCPELALARQLCHYGERLAPQFQFDGDVPFEEGYRDYGTFLEVLQGVNEEAGLAHFRAKIEPAIEDEGNTFPAEIFVTLLLKRDRAAEALAVAKEYLAEVKRPMVCPSLYELCLLEKDHAGLAEMAQKRGDAVHYLAGLLEARK